MLTLVAAALTVASVWLSGRKNIWAWPAGLAGAILWVWFALSIGDTGVLLMNGFFCFLYVYNFITWKGIDMFKFFRRNRPQLYGIDIASPINMQEAPPYLTAQDFVMCRTCKTTLFMPHAHQVELVAPDLSRFLAGRGMMGQQHLLPFDIAFYCYKDAPPYDRISYVVQGGGETSYAATVYREFFKVGYWNSPNHREYRQVDENGEQYD